VRAVLAAFSPLSSRRSAELISRRCGGILIQAVLILLRDVRACCAQS